MLRRWMGGELGVGERESRIWLLNYGGVLDGDDGSLCRLPLGI